MTMNAHTYKLFKNIFNDVQTEGKVEINMAKHNYSEMYCIFDNISLKGLNKHVFD